MHQQSTPINSYIFPGLASAIIRRWDEAVLEIAKYYTKSIEEDNKNKKQRRKKTLIWNSP